MPICIIVPQLRFLAECPKITNYHNCVKLLQNEMENIYLTNEIYQTYWIVLKEEQCMPEQISSANSTNV